MERGLAQIPAPPRALSLQRRRPGQPFPGVGGWGAEGTSHVLALSPGCGPARSRTRAREGRLRGGGHKPWLAPGAQGGGRRPAPQSPCLSALSTWPPALTHGALYKLRESVFCSKVQVRPNMSSFSTPTATSQEKARRPESWAICHQQGNKILYCPGVCRLQKF